MGRPVRVAYPCRTLTDSTGRAAVSEGIREHFTEDLKKTDIPVLVMHGDDDQIVPIGAAGLMSAKILKKAPLKFYPGFPHGMATVHADQINADLLAFFKGGRSRSRRRVLTASLYLQAVEGGL